MSNRKKNGKRITGTVLAFVLLIVFLVKTPPVLADDSLYRTTVVTRGTLSVQAQANLSFEYTNRTLAYYQGEFGNVKFSRYLVERYEYVEQGQPIVEVVTNADEIRVEELTLELQRTEEKLANLNEKMERDIADAKKKIITGNAVEAKIAKLRLEQYTMELKKEKKKLEAWMEDLEDELKKCEAALGTAQILAPVSGSVEWLNRYKTGDTLWYGAAFGEICSTEGILFSVPDTMGVLRYGMEVTITDGKSKTYTGMVVSCPGKYLSGNFKTEEAYIRPDELPEEWYNAKATYETVCIENVLLVDKAAVRNDKDGNYVIEQKDGKLSKCYFTAGKIVQNVCYAIDGLREGMTVVIQ